MPKKIALLGLSASEIVEALALSPSFRGKQIFSWLSKGVDSFEKMKNLDKTTLEKLNTVAVIYTSSVSKVLKDPDGTIKLQITLEDGRAIETVLLTDKEGRKTACVSCQAGCAKGCAFCPRCEEAMKICLNEVPEELRVSDSHLASCWMNVKEMFEGKEA